jgi:hypothetical protein
MAAFWAVFIFGGSGPAITAHGSLDLKQEIQIQILVQSDLLTLFARTSHDYIPSSEWTIFNSVDSLSSSMYIVTF